MELNLINNWRPHGSMYPRFVFGKQKEPIIYSLLDKEAAKGTCLFTFVVYRAYKMID